MHPRGTDTQTFTRTIDVTVDAVNDRAMVTGTTTDNLTEGGPQQTVTGSLSVVDVEADETGISAPLGSPPMAVGR